MGDPKRILDASRADSLGRGLLESARNQGPTHAQVEALWTSLATRLPAPGGSGTSLGEGSGKETSGAGHATTASALAKTVALVAMAGAAAVGLSRAAARDHSQRVPPSSVAEPRPIESERPAGADPANVAPAVGIVDGSPAVQVPSGESSVSARTRPSRQTLPKVVAMNAPKVVAPVAASRASPLGAEAALVIRARDALRDGDCANALASLDQNEAQFANGALVEEREALAIEAFACAGRRDEANARATAFLRAYPASLHASAVKRVALQPVPVVRGAPTLDR